ncbi:hypothetical protein AA309_26545 [Microvirga vignae]|uniref:Uncharacterized protein n=1 Tax=Microvirga vignae TaxID=1225564 RepID=A0A0H1R597_9HYPH|nr:hypothetical protein [Microvirga vignae]KLK90293.1 hypothetical protein AA309_26545 [Microvirga vignae]
MRFSDALSVLSQRWRVSVSELNSYHRALRAADAIPASSRGRGKDDVSEEALLRFVIAFFSSRQANTSPERLDAVLRMWRAWNSTNMKKAARPKRYEGSAPELFLQNTVLETLSAALKYYRETPKPKSLTFQFHHNVNTVFVTAGDEWFSDEGFASLPSQVRSPAFANYDSPYEGWEDEDSDYEESKTFGGPTLIALNRILAG